MGTLKESICKYCINPVKYGFSGFTIFFLVIIATKFLGTIFGSITKFSLDLEDIFLSMIGFVMFFFIKILNSFKERGREFN
jgi:hypothetical protein